ncbi:MAG: hypothetical protein NWR21_06065 [Verrucomicrobiales bacterium]|jgi:hypothetical protein|nr:hypothetical protein [Verrucomicrobiales bacterium]MDP4849383.1 hypothetical protein [Verrucomicrobiales bacterium]MDP4938861.1 hypothetical protein [Verrucomicrobiales bacterium]MDP5004809.1 hypothetical protein [Verrucomicrobiales bacterium]
MKRNIQPLATPVTSSNCAAATRGTGCSSAPTLFAAKVTKVEESVRSGLLGLCHEIAGLILRRHQEKNDPVAVRREVRARLVQMMSCTEERAERLIDLSLELVHVKIHGRYRRNPLELSILIARAGNQLREIGAN